MLPAGIGAETPEAGAALRQLLQGTEGSAFSLVLAGVASGPTTGRDGRPGGAAEGRDPLAGLLPGDEILPVEAGNSLPLPLFGLLAPAGDGASGASALVLTGTAVGDEAAGAALLSRRFPGPALAVGPVEDAAVDATASELPGEATQPLLAAGVGGRADTETTITLPGPLLAALAANNAEAGEPGPGLNPGGPGLAGAVTEAAARPAVEAAAQTERPVFQLTPRLEDPEFAAALGNRLLMQARDQLQFARLALNPPELGPVDVRIEVNRDVTNISFVAASPQVREALEDAIPRLREQFSSMGLSLGQADVQSGEQGAQGHAGHDAPAEPVPDQATMPLDALLAEPEPASTDGPWRAVGLVDAYA